MIRLIGEGRLEIGGSYIDRFEQLHEADSIIRQHLYAARWLKETFDIYPSSTCHADLPSMTPQEAQSYARSGIKYYLRARGPCNVSLFAAPDGSSVIYGSVDFMYGNITRKDIDDILKGIKKLPERIITRGGYGDLSMPNDEILGIIKEVKQAYPDIDFHIASPSRVLEFYLNSTEMDKLPIIKGEWPSGWASVSVLCVDNLKYSPQLGNLLFTAEKYTTISGMLGHALRSSTDEATWWLVLQRTKGDMEIPLIPKGKELEEAWKVGLFTQDHNYVEYAGLKSESDKIIMKKKAIAYTEDILAASLADIASHAILPATIGAVEVLWAIIIFNSLSWVRQERTEILAGSLKSYDREEIHLIDAKEGEIAFQWDGDEIVLDAQRISPVGYKTYYVTRKKSIGINQTTLWFNSVADGEKQLIESELFKLVLDLNNGSICSIFDKKSGRELTGGEPEGLFGEVISYENPGIDVVYTFTGKRTRDSHQAYKFYKKSAGPVLATFVMEGSIFDSKVVKEITIYRENRKIDFNLAIKWWGKKGENVRLHLPFSKQNYSQTWYGTSFYAVQWPKMMEGIDDDTILGISNVNADELSSEDRMHFRDVHTKPYEIRTLKIRFIK